MDDQIVKEIVLGPDPVGDLSSEEEENESDKARTRNLFMVREGERNFQRRVLETDGPPTEDELHEIEELVTNTIPNLVQQLEALIRIIYEKVMKEHELRELKIQLESPPPPTNEMKDDEIAPAVDPESKLPVEIWVNGVMPNLTDWKDRKNLMQSCSFFRDLMRMDRNEILYRSYLPSIWYSRYYSQQDLGMELERWPVPFHEFLCQHPSLRPFGWIGSGVGSSCAEDFPFVNPLRHFNRIKTENFRRGGFSTFFGPIQKPPPITERYGGRSHLLGNQLCLVLETSCFEGEVAVQALWDSVNDFMGEYGKDVWYLTLEMEKNPSRAYKQISTEFVMRHLPIYAPRMRKLAVRFCFDKELDEFDEATMNHYQPIVSLETLELRCTHDLPPFCETCPTAPIIKTLLNLYNTQLGKLHVTGKVWKEIARNLEWPNLVELCLDALVDCFEFASIRSCRRLGKLKKLALVGVVSRSESVNDCLEGVRELFEHASKTLSTLSLNGIHLDCLTRLHTDVVFPFPISLITLELNLEGHNFSSYLFLITRFPFIVNLQIYFGESRHPDHHSTGISFRRRRSLQFERYEDKSIENNKDQVLFLRRHIANETVYSSAVWNLLPRLNLLSYQFKKYDKKGYIANK